jgi:hypothetical protein
MELLIGIGGSIILAAIVATSWVRGIDYMKENHPDYKGEDFLNWKNDPENENDKHQIL